MKRAILLGLLLCGSALAQDNTKTLTWVPSLTYESGGTFDESQIELYELYCDGEYVQSIANDFSHRYVVGPSLLGYGSHTCGITERVAGIESLLSNTVSFDLGQPTPGAPVLTVE